MKYSVKEEPRTIFLNIVRALKEVSKITCGVNS